MKVIFLRFCMGVKLGSFLYVIQDEDSHEDNDELRLNLGQVR